jgi:dihydroorotate dehydrogenase
MFLLPPERVHGLVFAALQAATRPAWLRSAVAKALVVRDPALRSTVFGVEFPNPMGLAAGFDKNAEGIDTWGALGFGYAEVGTLTPKAQPGNPKPRLFRLPADKAILNRMGFNNDGAENAAINVQRAAVRDIPIAANIGKNKLTPAGEAVADYRIGAETLGPLADFVVVNVSSPNTPGLRDLQAVDSLRPILAAVRDAVSVPVLVKIAPDLSDEDVDAIADLAVELSLAGIVATNTTISRAGLATSHVKVAAAGPGGISGPPVAERSLALLRRLYARVGAQLVIISCGGITTADDAWQRITAGASLIQGYTGFIYHGAFWTRTINRGLARKLRAAGFASISEAVGSAPR